MVKVTLFNLQYFEILNLLFTLRCVKVLAKEHMYKLLGTEVKNIKHKGRQGDKEREDKENKDKEPEDEEEEGEPKSRKAPKAKAKGKAKAKAKA